MTSLAPPAGFSPGRGGASSPWAQIVAGDPDSPPPAAAVSPPLIEQLVASGAAEERLAWRKPGNAAAEVEPVMGADSWPALSESTKAPAKSPTESSFPVSEPITQGITLSSQSSQKQANPPNLVPARQRSMKRNGGGNTSTNGGFPQPPAPLVDTPPTNLSPSVTLQRSGFVSHSNNGNNNLQRYLSRNRNGGPQPRGDGSQHHNHGGRRDQDRGNQDWNTRRHYSGRNTHIHQYRGFPRFVAPPPPPSAATFIPPSSFRHFGSPAGFPELATQVYFVATQPPPESLRGAVPFMGPMPPHAVFLHAPDFQLHGKIVNQIDYYFSNENLIKDTYLRQNMDEQGWVPIKLLAGFKQVKLLTENIQLIADSVRASTVVEVQDEKVRRRNDWMRWVMPPAIQFSNRANSQPSGTASHDMLATSFQGLNLDENATNSSGGARNEASFNASGEVNSQPNLSNSEGTGEHSVPLIN